jgi:hypothetical protein
MQRIEIEVDPTPEVVVQVTWRQWEDGRWEAWLVDESGLPAQQVGDRWALERFFDEAWRRALLLSDESDR